MGFLCPGRSPDWRKNKGFPAPGGAPAGVKKYDKYFSDHSIRAVFKTTAERVGADVLNDKWKTLLSPDRKMNNEEMYEKLIPNYSKVIEYGEELIL